MPIGCLPDSATLIQALGALGGVSWLGGAWGPLVGGYAVGGEGVGELLAGPGRAERLGRVGGVVDDQDQGAVGVLEGHVVEVRGGGRGDALGAGLYELAEVADGVVAGVVGH